MTEALIVVVAILIALALAFLFKMAVSRPSKEYQYLMAKLADQQINGVDLSRYANVDGRVEARLCECGLYRRDLPPGTYVCGCTRLLYKSPTVLMCKPCSDRILEARSSYASFLACDDCRSKWTTVSTQP